MTVSSSNRKAGPFLGNGVTTTFPFTFKVFKKEDVLVTFTDSNGADTELILDSQYSVALNNDQNNNPGGTITYPTVASGLPTLPTGQKLTLTGDLAYTQPTDLPNLGPYFAEVVEDALDRAEIQLQQIKEITDRSIKISVSDTPLTPLPTAAARANMLIGFDATGNLTVLPVTTSIGAGDRIPQTWVGGTDFAAGVTTQLTLARAPGSQGNLEVMFDGVPQGFDQWSVNGSVLTFATPIPVGISKIFAYIGTTLSTSIPPGGSVGDSQLIWDGTLDRMVPTVAALRQLDGTKYTSVGTRGYYAANGMGAAEFDKDPTDITSVDNNGTIIVGADGTRWKMRPRAQVSAACFGVIPGVANVGARLNQAAADHVGKYRLLIPQGQILTGTTIIDFPVGSDASGVGPVNSNYGPAISTAPHGTQIISAVPNDYAVRLAYNAPMVGGGTNFGNLEIKNPVGKGFYAQSMGTGAQLQAIAVHDCLQEGAYFDYFQDSSLVNLEVVNCGGATSYGVTFATNCNACRVDKLLIVQCRQPLLVKDSTFFDFYNPHIEQGEYPGPPNDVVNCAYIAGGFKFQNCQHINLYGGVFVPNSTGFLANFYSIAESATSFYLTADSACKNIKMFGPKFSSPLKGSRFVSADNIELIGPAFNGAVSTVNSIQGTNFKIRGGQAELYDDQSQTVMTFAYMAGRSRIDDFEVICSNPSAATKTSGALFDGTALDLGNYRVTVDKFFADMGSAVSYRGSHGAGGTGYSLSGGTIDIQKQNAGDAIIVNTISGALLSLNNYHGLGNKYTVVNNTGGNLTVGTGGNISTPSTITVPAFGSIDLKHIPGTTALSPVV